MLGMNLVKNILKLLKLTWKVMGWGGIGYKCFPPETVCVY